MKTSFLILLLLSTLVIAADKAPKMPKEMEPKLHKTSAPVFFDDFSAAALDAAWQYREGDFLGKVTPENGSLRLDPGVSRQGGTARMFPQPLGDAAVQFLVRPFGAKFMSVRFISGVADGENEWKFAMLIRPAGSVSLVLPGEGADDKKPVYLESAKIDLKPDEWWRVSMETRGEQVLVRINGKELINLKNPAIATPKVGLLLMLGQGALQIDEVKVTKAAG